MHGNFPENRITAAPDSLKSYLLKLWKFRSLILAFALRDLKTKYAQTVLGVAWSLLNPIIATLIFSFFFGHVLAWEIDGMPFPIYVLSGLIPWNFFVYITTAGTSSIQESSQLIKKIYFPKSILPVSKIIVALVDLGLSLAVLLLLIIYYKQQISLNLLIMPLAIVFNALCALTLVFWISALAYKKRDLLHIIPFLTYFGIWLTPVFFKSEILPTKIQPYLALNPMHNAIELWRFLLFNYGTFNPMWFVSFIITLLLCISGMYFYSTKEHQFSDFA